ncbi:MAG: PrsW family glutamic-type intramembrane protease [Candidatus Hodarchaeota archaeon]
MLLLLNQDVVIAAILTTLFLGLVLIFVQYRLSITPKKYYSCIAIALPLSALINIIKIPILHILFSTSLEKDSLVFLDLILWLVIVGISEEVVKVLPVFLPYLNKIEHSSQQLAILGWCLGAGFGIGEIWFLTIQISMQIEETQYNWLTLLSGFGFERFFVVFAHITFTLIALKGLEIGRRKFLETITLAALFHGVFDSPILLHTAGYLTYFEMIMIVFLELILTFMAAFYLFYINYTSVRILEDERTIQKSNLLLRAKEAWDKAEKT